MECYNFSSSIRGYHVFKSILEIPGVIKSLSLFTVGKGGGSVY